LRDVMSGALQAIAYVLQICENSKDGKEIRRKVEVFRDWLLSGAADDVRSQMPRRK
jgi:hypothetical protein